ncbi:MAG: hypothetical protein RMZ43_011935 [Nostoc sp. CmiVER01]|uniref:hypothetical protein n=1 Tax=Nostoc sp. CmiVER01 TaxID=3075384 RepID=UPI002AD4E074|nr:hypothetical protein [Nostoc sp. CmiVER01]MDZ8121499.1 hypothetical protein [Nostoc sp. CmiVER01]
MPKKHIVKLTQEQHQQLVEIVKKGKATARMIRRAHTLLMASSGETDDGIKFLESFIFIAMKCDDYCHHF